MEVEGVAEEVALVQCQPWQLPGRPDVLQLEHLSVPSLLALDLFLVLLTRPIFPHLGAQNESTFDTPLLPGPNHRLLILLPGSIPVLDHIEAKGLGSQSDSTPASAICSSCPPSYE